MCTFAHGTPSIPHCGGEDPGKWGQRSRVVIHLSSVTAAANKSLIHGLIHRLSSVQSGKQCAHSAVSLSPNPNATACDLAILSSLWEKDFCLDVVKAWIFDSILFVIFTCPTRAHLPLFCIRVCLIHRYSRLVLLKKNLLQLNMPYLCLFSPQKTIY